MNLHGPVRAALVEGTAKVVVSLSTWSEGKVQPTVHEITVRPAKKGQKTGPPNHQPPQHPPFQPPLQLLPQWFHAA